MIGSLLCKRGARILQHLFDIDLGKVIDRGHQGIGAGEIRRQQNSRFEKLYQRRGTSPVQRFAGAFAHACSPCPVRCLRTAFLFGKHRSAPSRGIG